VQLLAQAAQQSPADGITWPLLLTVLVMEGTLLTLAWNAFNAEARVAKDRDADIRDARAGAESGLVLPAVAKLIEVVDAARQPGDETIADALDRADTARPLRAVLEAAAVASGPREVEQRLVRAWTLVGFATIGIMLSGPFLVWNEVMGSDAVSRTVQIVAGSVLSGSVFVALVAAFVVRHFQRSLVRSIKRGKDAADES
jgi:hypothetical protein